MNYSEFNEYQKNYFEYKDISFNSQSLSDHVWGEQIIKQQDEERKERERIELEKYELKLKREREQLEKQRKLENKIKEEEYIEVNETDMWNPGKDYPDILVPLSIKRIPALDKANFVELWLQRYGEFNIVNTLVGSLLEPYTIEEYYEKFCVKQNINGETKYIFTKNKV